MKKWILSLMLICCFSASASIIKKPPVKQAEVTYENLVCTEQDKAHIYEIISTMGEHGKLSLLFKQNHLRELGSHIEHLHPFKFLSTIITHPYLKSCMFPIWEDSFKKSHFLSGVGSKLNIEVQLGKLNQYVKDFAKEVNVPAESLKPFLDARDWEGLVYYLMNS